MWFLPDCRQTRRRARMRANHRRITLTSLLGPGGARNRRGLRETGTKESGWAAKARWEEKPGTWLTGPPCPESHRAASCGLPRFSFPPRQARPRPSSQAPDSRRPRQPGKVRVSPGRLPRLCTSDEYRVTSQPVPSLESRVLCQKAPCIISPCLGILNMASRATGNNSERRATSNE